MRQRFYFTLLACLLLPIVSFSQNPLLTPYSGQAEAFSRISFTQIVEDEMKKGDADLWQLKKPNPVQYRPVFDIDPSTIVYVEPAGFGSEDVFVRSATTPLPDTTFNGLFDSGNSIPPDVNGAPGPDHLMITLNTQVRIQHRNGQDISTVSLGSFWQSLPGSGTFDPKILYDFEDDRWIFVTCAGSTPGDSRIYMGVSASSDPTGVWYLYSYIADPQNIVWFDYPSMGFNKKWIVVSGNMFGNDFYSTVYVFDKHAMYQGVSNPSFKRFATNDGFTLVPAITYDAQEENVYLISSANGNQGGQGFISLFKVSGPTENPQFSTIGNIGTPNPWAGYVGNNGDFLPQLGSVQKINAVDHRMENVIFRNNKLWATHHVFLPANNPTRTAVQWWNINTDGQLLQRGRIDDPSGLYSYAFPTIAVNQFEDILIGHNIFSTQQYASAGYSYRAHFDPINQVRMPYQYKSGLAPYYKTFGGGRNRWGDYSATMLDPLNSVDFWVLQEYAELPMSGDRWGTWWAYVRIPFNPVPDFTANETLIPLGENISFSDLSAGVPQSWLWNFEGGQPAQSILQHPSEIQFNTEGSFNISLTVSNEFGTNSATKNSFITVSSSLLPVVDFVVDKQLVCTSEPVSFQDHTIYMPRQWQWSFDPPTVTYVDGTSAQSKNPKVVFDQPGEYTVTLTAFNLNGSSSLSRPSMIRAGGRPLPFRELFESQSFAAANWSIHNPDNGKTWDLVQVAGLDETTKAARLDFLTYFAIGQRDRLITPPLDLRAYNQMQLTFKHAYAKRLAQVADSLIVYATDNCGLTWTRIFATAENGSGNFATHPLTQGFVPQQRTDWCGAGFGAPCIALDISSMAGKENVKIAFETYSFYGNPLYLTDIEIGPTVGLTTDLPIESMIEIYPNPAAKSFRIRPISNSTIERVSVFSTDGRKVISLSQIVPGAEIAADHLSSGMYIVQLHTGNRIHFAKLLIE